MIFTSCSLYMLHIFAHILLIADLRSLNPCVGGEAAPSCAHGVHNQSPPPMPHPYMNRYVAVKFPGHHIFSIPLFDYISLSPN